VKVDGMVMEEVVVTVTIEVMEILYAVSIIQHVVAQLKMREVDNHNQILLESLTLVRLVKH
jgi:hypothetical protein